jgi:hypothetical protein
MRDWFAPAQLGVSSCQLRVADSPNRNFTTFGHPLFSVNATQCTIHASGFSLNGDNLRNLLRVQSRASAVFDQSRDSMTSPDENATLAEPLLRPSEDHFKRNETCNATVTQGEDGSEGSTEIESLNEAKRKHTRTLLYTSHFLSTWNSRLFEFGAFLFLANIYPQTLLPASLYALCRNASAAIAAPWIGNYIDRADRLVVVRISIGTNTCTRSVIWKSFRSAYVY